MADIDVRLPDGRLIRITGAESDDAARTAVQSMLQQERRDAPRTGSSFARGIDEFQGNLYSGAEGAGRATGLNWLEQFGREGRLRNEREAEASQPSSQRQTFADAETPGDYTRATLQALGNTAAPSAVGMSGAAAGAALGAPLGPLGAIAGGIIGGGTLTVWVVGLGLGLAVAARRWGRDDDDQTHTTMLRLRRLRVTGQRRAVHDDAHRALHLLQWYG